MKISVIMPVYNEKRTILRIIGLIESVPVEKEIIIVDDGSTDGTRDIIREHLTGRQGYKIILHDKNKGKGSAIRSGIAAAEGGAVIIQDADMEYDPMDYIPLVEALEKNPVNVVYGSRFLAKKKVTYVWHRFVNYFLTGFTNLIYGSHLTDMETCYKLFRAETIKSLPLESRRFEIEVELTAKTLKRGERILEVPISYTGRSFREGKKIGWRDGVKAVATLFRYRFFP